MVRRLTVGYCFFFSYNVHILVYVVLESGWQKVFSGDTMETYFKYYPVNQLITSKSNSGDKMEEE